MSKLNTIYNCVILTETIFGRGEKVKNWEFSHKRHYAIYFIERFPNCSKSKYAISIQRTKSLKQINTNIKNSFNGYGFSFVFHSFFFNQT